MEHLILVAVVSMMALYAYHSRLPETARMVTPSSREEVINMNTLSTPLSKEEKHAHNEIAAVLSIVPGLGHIYKGHDQWGLCGCFSACRSRYSSASYLSLVLQVLVYSSQSGAGQLLRMMPTEERQASPSSFDVGS